MSCIRCVRAASRVTLAVPGPLQARPVAPQLAADPAEAPCSYDRAMRRADDGMHSLFVDAVDIPAYLESDRDRPYAERLHRDRTIGASLPFADPLRRVRVWSRTEAQAASALASENSLGRSLERGRRIITFAMLIIGALAGAGVASAVFNYDGTWPVNVVTVVAVLVLLQAALVIITLILMLPRAPGLRALQDLFGGLNPGAVAAAIYRRMVGLDESRADLLVSRYSRGPAAARFARWQMLTWSQVAALAFNVAALGVAIALITFTDLAFGWSTTLRIEADDVRRITHALAAPWRAIWPEAVPSTTLIESSRFFRLVSAPAPQAPADALTGWWPFLLAALITYGLAPRCILLIIALARLRAATAHLLLDHPQVRALLERMNTAEVALGAQAEDGVASSPHTTATARPAPARPSSSRVIAIVWSGAIAKDAAPEWSLQRLQRETMLAFEAGGGRRLDDDQAVIRSVAAAAPTALLIFVRAWEAPLLELRDFLLKLREAVGPACSIIIVPVGSGACLAADTHRAMWARWVGGIADPAMYVETGA